MNDLTLFLAASALLIITPGPDVVYVLTRGIAGGWRAGIASALGVNAGILVHATAAAMGVAVLLTASSWAFWTLKIGGGLYLIYVAWGMLRSRDLMQLGSARPTAGMRKCFVQGFLSNVLNPKVALFFVAFLPQFVDPAAAGHTLRIFELGGIFALMGTVFLTGLGLFAGHVGLWLRRRAKLERGIRVGTASMLALLGVQLMLPERR
jgi:threonine/homoserine/homoserine lactone efflux protein